MQHVRVEPRPIHQVTKHFEPGRLATLQHVAPSVRAAMQGRTVWNIAPVGLVGGAHDMVRSNLSGVGALGVDTAWVTIDTEPEFLATRRELSRLLYGMPGAQRPLDHVSCNHYEKVLAAEAQQFAHVIRPGDITLLHDPATAGLAEALQKMGAKVVWRFHGGTKHRNEHTAQGWEFLRPYLAFCDRILVSVKGYGPPWAHQDIVTVMAPSIDGSSTRNRPMTNQDVQDTLTRANLAHCGRADRHVDFVRADGTIGAVRRHYDLVLGGQTIDPNAPLVLQVNRWDQLKDVPGVMRGFAGMVGLDPAPHLAVVGPTIGDSHRQEEAARSFAECEKLWHQLPQGVRHRIHLIRMPQDDPEETSYLINALQHHATIVVQKSLAEGFGLAITEALWKSKPVVVSGVGGLAEQVHHDITGLVVDDATDLAGFSTSVATLLTDPQRAARLGAAGRERVREHYLADRHLLQFADLLLQLS